MNKNLSLSEVYQLAKAINSFSEFKSEIDSIITKTPITVKSSNDFILIEKNKELKQPYFLTVKSDVSPEKLEEFNKAWEEQLKLIDTSKKRSID